LLYRRDAEGDSYMRLLKCLGLLLGLIPLLPAPAGAEDLEAGVAITDPAVLKELEFPQPTSRGFRIDALLAPTSNLATPIKNDNLFRSVLSPVANNLTKAIEGLPAQSLDSDVRHVFSTQEGTKHWLWRAVDQNGFVLDAWFRAAVTSRQPNGSCASSSANKLAHPGNDHR
jgi:hypothetical protein